MRRIGGLALALALAACAPPPHRLPPSPVPAGPGITVEATPVTPSQVQFGRFAYRGGLHLTSSSTSLLRGLSDVVVGRDNRLLAVSDSGADLFSARLVLDARGRLVGVREATLTPLAGPDGRPLTGADGDAEGLAVLPGGDLLVSFEQRPRILRIPPRGGRAQLVPAPPVSGGNDGMEALGADPARGADAYVVGEEYTGRTWTCRIAAGCADGPPIALTDPQAITSVKRLKAGRTAWLIRSFHWLSGRTYAHIRILDAAGRVEDELVLDSQAVRDRDHPGHKFVDNFEGLAAVERDDGSVRFYLLSDDNGGANRQRTLLLAFDWTPAR